MPVSREQQQRYPGGSLRSAEWLSIRRRILERAGHCCEFCGVPDRVYVWREGEAYEVIGSSETFSHLKGIFPSIVLTVAHLDHDPGNSVPENLRTLCQRCHNRYDAAHRAATRRRNLRARWAIGDLFDEGPQASA